MYITTKRAWIEDIAVALCRILKCVIKICEWGGVAGACVGGGVEGWKRIGVDGTRE